MKNKYFIWLLLIFNLLVITAIFIVVVKYSLANHISAQATRKSTILEDFDFNWPSDKKMALSITFDDGVKSQIDSGIPILDKYGVKGTFYITLYNTQKNLEAWKIALNNGHEIGNHTVKHPCSINYDDIIENALEDYTLTKMKNELDAQNEVIKKQLGITPVSFAYPCGNSFVGRGLNTKSYVPLISSTFESGRLYNGGSVDPVYCDMAQLPSEKLDDRSFNEIKELIEYTKKAGKWLILTGHHVGEGYSTTSKTATLEAICKYAKDTSNGIWIDNVHNIASYINEKRGNKPFVQASNYLDPISMIYVKLWAVYYVEKMKYLNNKNSVNLKTAES